MKKFWGVLGALIAMFSAFFVFAAMGDIIGGTSKTQIGVLWGLLVFFAMSGAGGVWLAKLNLFHTAPKVVPLSEFEQEQRILSLAENNDGRVTVPEVAAHCRLSVKDSKAALLRLASQGAAELHLTEKGIEVYAFPGFMPEEIKAAASDPFLEDRSEHA